MAIIVRRLDERDDVDNFDCGDGPLNTYLKRHAWRNQEKISIGVTYVAVDEGVPQAVLGYFTLATANVPRAAFPKKYVRGLPPYDLPMILLARLAVDRRFAGRGLGHALISEAFRICLWVADEVGCRCIITDAYRDRVSWYAKYGFVPIATPEPPACAASPPRNARNNRDVRATIGIRCASGAKAVNGLDRKRLESRGDPELVAGRAHHAPLVGRPPVWQVQARSRSVPRVRLRSHTSVPRVPV